ncbi:MAG: hypothetical protein ACREL3_01645 [Gemmatimonadales bacterium]
MYRIELRPGEETVFRTIEELATGIRNGLVTPKARIYHNASQKWLPVEFHPHYKKALAMPAAKSGETPAVSMPPRGSALPAFLAPAPVAPPVAPAPVAPAPVAPVLAAPARAPEPIATRPAPIAKAPAPSGLVFVQLDDTEPAVAVASPVIALPTIAYEQPKSEPEAEEIAAFGAHVTVAHATVAHASVAHASSARARIGRPRPLHLGIAAAVLIVGTYVAVSAASPARKAAERTPSQESAQPSPVKVAPPAQGAASATADSALAKTIAAPGTGGPTFGGPPAPAAPRHPITASIGAAPAVPAAAADSTIVPPPAEVDLSIPSLPRGDSLAPTATTDSNAMRRILRAVGGKGASATPAQP